ncbi:MAG: ATP-binding protein [Desulfobacterales bacterium]|nr:ATP-binding protein [Desulfobacterales bacterium]
MIQKSSKKSAFKAGMYLLETLTAGMYNNPMSIYREYIQNAADSIDFALRATKSKNKKIYIDLDPKEKSIKIYDEGFGISADHAEEILSSIGLSSKKEQRLRGFRGIGRLGGLAFCERAIFRTKSKGEGIESIQEWDCNALRNFVSGTQKKTSSLKQLFDNCTYFYHENGKRKGISYFEVKLEGVQSFRNHLMDIKKLHDFISFTAPVPFNYNELSFAKDIDKFLSSKINNFSHHEIILNGDQVYKPYSDMVKLTSKGHDYIVGVEFFEIRAKGSVVAYGWYGKRKDLLGAITKGDLTSGIRVRVGDIQIGDNHLLDSCFRENRFNSYMIGEIHVDSPELIPNSRRDNFIDNEIKEIFYNEIERKLGIPLSKEIRYQSGVRAKNNTLADGKVEGSCHSKREDSKVSKKMGKTKTDEVNFDDNPSKKNTELLKIFKKRCKDCHIFQDILKENI